MHTRLRPIPQDSRQRLLQQLQAGHERAHSDVQRAGARSDEAVKLFGRRPDGVGLISQCVAGSSALPEVPQRASIDSSAAAFERAHVQNLSGSQLTAHPVSPAELDARPKMGTSRRGYARAPGRPCRKGEAPERRVHECAQACERHVDDTAWTHPWSSFDGNGAHTRRTSGGHM